MKQTLLNSKLIDSLPDGTVRQVSVGMMWTAVVVEIDGSIQGGIAATLKNPGYEHSRLPLVSNPGELERFSTRDLAALIQSTSHTEASIGLAAINALLPRQPKLYSSIEAANWLVEHGSQKNVAMVGHFHFIERLQSQVKKLWVLELDPRPGDFPAQAAPEIIPQADIVAITATTLINHTCEGLLELCRPDAEVMLLGPSTPLSPVMFGNGVDVLAGTLVEDPFAVARVVTQGGTSSQYKKYTRQVLLQK